MWLVECILISQPLANEKRRDKIKRPTTQESSSPNVGDCEICAIVFLQQKFVKCCMSTNIT